MAKFRLLVLVICCLHALTLQQRAEASAQRWKASGSFFALSVRDIVSITRWYQSSLGFEVLREADSSGAEVRSAMLERDGNLIEVVQRDTASAPPRMPDRSYQHGIFKVGFWVADVDSLARELKQKKVAFVHGVVRPPGAGYRTFAVTDPEANVVQFFGG